MKMKCNSVELKANGTENKAPQLLVEPCSTPEYEAFVEKFKPKLTTDDCYTPQLIYDTVRDWACEKYGIDPEKIVRPFWPGSDYEEFDYPEGCVVLDNPPFSILTKICAFYLDRGIPFFLFAPSLTAFTGRSVAHRMNHIIVGASIEYENGANVNTAFVTSYGGDTVAETAPDLSEKIASASKRFQKERTKKVPVYTYPDHVLTAAMLTKYTKRGIHYRVSRDECAFVPALDAQRARGASIYGGGMLLSDAKAAERAAAERAAAERAAAERAAAIKWELSEREKMLVAELSKGGNANEADTEKSQGGH